MNRHSFKLRWVSAISLLLTVLWLGVVRPATVAAATFAVDRADDEPSATACTAAPNDCSLRGAISRANTNGGANVISLPAGTYSLSNGVLSITSFPTINGAGADITVISGGNSSPVFTVPFSAIFSTGLTLNDVTLTLGSNAGTANGGCIVNGHTLTLNNSIVEHCHAGQDGGGIYNGSGGTVQLNNSIVRYNVADRNCGGISDHAGVTVSGSTILSNTAQTGGGLCTNYVMTLTNSTVMSNSAAVDGGGLYNNSLLTLIHVSVIGNSANGGGSQDNGGGLFNVAGTATITDSTFSGNSAPGINGRGGGISSASGGTVNLTNVTLDNNNSTVHGGGIFSAGTLMLTNVTLSGNAGGNGGGIDSAGTMTLTNVTLSGNSAGVGGGINSGGMAALSNVTFSGNHAGFYGGIHNSGTTVLTNTILANSTSGGNCSAPPGGSFNLSDDNSCGFGSGRDNVNNLMLAPLGNYGGPTLTHIPLPGSFAIDNGTNTGCPSTDQRGKPRPAGLACDAGAVERQLLDFSFLYLPLMRK